MVGFPKHVLPNTEKDTTVNHMDNYLEQKKTVIHTCAGTFANNDTGGHREFGTWRIGCDSLNNDTTHAYI